MMRRALFIFFIFLLFPFLGFTENTIELNTASLAQLEELVGVGPVTAQKIIDARPFSSVDDLLRVKGIGEKTLQKIKDQGLAYVSLGSQEIIQPKSDTPGVEIAPTQASQSNYPSNIFFNEILPAPSGADQDNEWVEIYNANNSNINLTGWKIQDTKGTMATYIFPENTTISAKGYLVLKRLETNIVLNNETDSLKITSPDEAIIDSVSYQNAKVNQSYNKTASGWTWSTILTPSAPNITSPILSKSKKTANNIATASLLDAINNTEEKNQHLANKKDLNPWLLFIIAIIITIISGATILLVKLKLLKNNIPH